MKTFVISLKRSTERRQRMLKMLDTINHPFEFFDATDGTISGFELSERRIDSLTKKRFGYHLTNSEIGCFASHFRVWNKCLALNESILVLEDNVVLSLDFEKILSITAPFSEKYSLIKLGATFPKKYKKIEGIDLKYCFIRYTSRTSGLMGYIISPKAAKALVENASQFIEPVDEYMEKPWKHNISTYCISPALVMRGPIESTIGSNRKNKKNIHLGNKVVIELFRLYEQLKNKLAFHND